MAISGHQKAQITARSGVLRSGTGRMGAVGDDDQIFVTDSAPDHYAGEFIYTEKDAERPEDPPTTAYTNVAR